MDKLVVIVVLLLTVSTATAVLYGAVSDEVRAPLYIVDVDAAYTINRVLRLGAVYYYTGTLEIAVSTGGERITILNATFKTPSNAYNITGIAGIQLDADTVYRLQIPNFRILASPARLDASVVEIYYATPDGRIASTSTNVEVVPP